MENPVVEKIKTVLCRKLFFFENRNVYENVENTVEPDSPQITVLRMRIACWIRLQIHNQNM